MFNGFSVCNLFSLLISDVEYCLSKKTGNVIYFHFKKICSKSFSYIFLYFDLLLCRCHFSPEYLPRVDNPICVLIKVNKDFDLIIHGTYLDLKS